LETLLKLLTERSVKRLALSDLDKTIVDFIESSTNIRGDLSFELQEIDFRVPHFNVENLSVFGNQDHTRFDSMIRQHGTIYTSMFGQFVRESGASGCLWQFDRIDMTSEAVREATKEFGHKEFDGTIEIDRSGREEAFDRVLKACHYREMDFGIKVYFKSSIGLRSTINGSFDAESYYEAVLSNIKFVNRMKKVGYDRAIVTLRHIRYCLEKPPSCLEKMAMFPAGFQTENAYRDDIKFTAWQLQVLYWILQDPNNFYITGDGSHYFTVHNRRLEAKMTKDEVMIQTVGNSFKSLTNVLHEVNFPGISEEEMGVFNAIYNPEYNQTELNVDRDAAIIDGIDTTIEALEKTMVTLKMAQSMNRETLEKYRYDVSAVIYEKIKNDPMTYSVQSNNETIKKLANSLLSKIEEEE